MSFHKIVLAPHTPNDFEVNWGFVKKRYKHVLLAATVKFLYRYVVINLIVEDLDFRIRTPVCRVFVWDVVM